MKGLSDDALVAYRRRLVIVVCVLAGFAVFFLHSVGLSSAAAYVGDWWPGHESPEKQAERILKTTPLIDGHNDLAWTLREHFHDHLYNDFPEPFTRGGLRGQTDIARLRKGRVGGQFWSAFVPCPTPSYAVDEQTGNMTFPVTYYERTVRETIAQIDVIHRLTAAYPDVFAPPALSSDEALRHFHEHGRIMSPIGVEGLHQIGNQVANLRLYHQLGVRYITLTHNCYNRYADPAMNYSDLARPYWGGLSADGRLVIREMNRIGLMVDLAHVSEDVMVDVLGGRDEWEGTQAPAIFSHSGVFSICPHPRNVPDRVLDLVKRTRSVVMINFSAHTNTCHRDEESGEIVFEPDRTTLATVADHIVYVGERIGYEYVGLGADFNGLPQLPKDLADVSYYPDLVAELLRRGVGRQEVRQIVGLNVLRVWREVEAVAAKMQRAGVRPLEDFLPPAPVG